MNSAHTLHLAMQNHQAGNLREAEQLYRQILQAEPRHADALHLLGVIALQVGRHDFAVEAIRAALREKSGFPEAHCNLGVALKTLGQLEEAVACFRQAVSLKPDYAEAHNNLGNALRQQDKPAEAITSLQQAVRLRPADAGALTNMGLALHKLGRLDEAASHYERALSLKPDEVDTHHHLGTVRAEQGKLDEAAASLRQALRLKPDFAEALSNLGGVLKLQGKQVEAADCFRQAVHLMPNLAEAHLNLAVHLLAMGDFAQGWSEFEWRWQTNHMKPELRHFPQPLWQGNPLPHGTILLHAEQGLGDTIQFIRFAALVKERVGNVFCECPPALARLLQSCAGIDRIIPGGEPWPLFDVHAPLMSLPGILKTTLATIPARIPYLHANSELTEAQARALGSSQDFKIGVVWQGNPKSWDPNLNRADSFRSFPLAHFEPLARLPGVRLISLQKGPGAEQLQELAGRFPIVDLGGTCNDFSDTAAVMKNLDLVISVDSSPAHLAGALGVPVWVALPSVCCWRWLLEREDSPWYPTMRLFRQRRQGDWGELFTRIAAAGRSH